MATRVPSRSLNENEGPARDAQGKGVGRRQQVKENCDDPSGRVRTFAANSGKIRAR